MEPAPVDSGRRAIDSTPQNRINITGSSEEGKMSTEFLRDRNGNQIGEIETASDGQQVIRDKNGNRLGEYSPRDNVTRDNNGNHIGEGNLLTRFL